MQDGWHDTAGREFGFAWGATTDRGRVRQENEDHYWVNGDIGLFLVADGMGGHQGGALASRIVAEDLPVMLETRLGRVRSHSPRALRRLFKQVIVEQSRQLWMEGTSESGYRGMGATLVMVMLAGGRAYVGNLGDSRVYRYRGGRLLQLSEDHSVVSELLEAGVIAPEEAADHDAQGQITRYVGMEERAQPYVRSFELVKGDRLLLCTDGLTDMVAVEAIGATLGADGTAQEACEALVSAANEAGGHDNVTVVLVDWGRPMRCEG